MTFERTLDLQVVRRILTHPKIWPHIGDDFSPNPEEFEPNTDPRIWYVLVKQGVRVIGLFIFLPESPVCWEVHVAMLPAAWGRISRQAGSRIIRWIWVNPECRQVQRIVARVPERNLPAVEFGFQSMRLKQFGRNEKSFLKNGKLIDQILMGISREN